MEAETLWRAWWITYRWPWTSHPVFPESGWWARWRTLCVRAANIHHRPMNMTEHVKAPRPAQKEQTRTFGLTKSTFESSTKKNPFTDWNSARNLHLRRRLFQSHLWLRSQLNRKRRSTRIGVTLFILKSFDLKMMISGQLSAFITLQKSGWMHAFVSFHEETRSGHLNEDSSAKGLRGPAAHAESGRAEPLGPSSAEVVWNKCPGSARPQTAAGLFLESPHFSGGTSSSHLQLNIAQVEGKWSRGTARREAFLRERTGCTGASILSSCPLPLLSGF